MKKLLGILALVLAACFHNSAPGPTQPETTLRVQNQAFSDMTIYMLRGSERVRLGTAVGLSTVILTIPSRVLHGPTALRFLADPIGGPRQPVTEEITVSAGDEVTLMIPPG